MVAVYPTAPVVPRNLLRLHIQFDEPTPEGASRSVRVQRATTGEVIAGALLALEPELWDGTHRRLTVLLDPARIKRGLAPHREAGYPLVEGEDVRVVIGEHTVTYRVGPDIRTKVDLGAWRVAAPVAGTTDPLVVDFDRPLDFALLSGCMRVRDVAGTGAVGEHEQSWAFFPAAPWRPGIAILDVDARLEDLAGNSVARVFDRDLTQPDDDPLAVDRVSLPITVPPAGARGNT
jgi:hypothetical protein